MNLHDLSPAKGSKKSRRRVGRGPGSGRAKTAGRGHKGGQSRAGYRLRRGFEGGQMPLVRRLPKRGFNNIFRTEYAVVNVADLERFKGAVNPELLAAAGLVHRGVPVKVLGHGEVKQALHVTAQKFSATARAKIEAAGGSCRES